MPNHFLRSNKEIIRWAGDYLSSHGYVLENTLSEIVKDTPWSYVVRFLTSAGYIYLKYTPALLALEAPIIQNLHEKFHSPVPEIIAHNADLNCFLMKDAGKPLREILKEKFDVNLILHAINNFTVMQVKATCHINIFLELGVPDWRLNQLPNLFSKFFLEKEIVIDEGLSTNEIAALEKLIPEISQLCEKLYVFPIKETIVQPDFNDNNTLSNSSRQMTIIDLGEIVISHPFFSWLNFLQQMKKHHLLVEESNLYLKIKEACFKNYLHVASKAQLLEAFTIANKLWSVYRMLAQYRLMLACDNKELIAFQGRGKLSSQIKEFINQF